MEIPNDIWYKIVNQSLKTNDDIIGDMDLSELKQLQNKIILKKQKIYKSIKSNFNKYDIISVYSNDNIYIMDCIIIDYINIATNIISVIKLYNGVNKTILGNYYSANMYNQNISLDIHKIYLKLSLVERNNENIKIANTLKVGDVFIYSIYTGAEFCKLRNRIYEMNTLDEGLKFGVVNKITLNKIMVINYTNLIVKNYKYIYKNTILKKIDYNDNSIDYIKMKKKFMYACMIDINNINDNVEYFKNVDKKQLIKQQKKLFINQ